jgi:hypothetical protein
VVIWHIFIVLVYILYRFGVFCGDLVNFYLLGYICKYVYEITFWDIFVVIWYIFPRFGMFYQKNLATLVLSLMKYTSAFAQKWPYVRSLKRFKKCFSRRRTQNSQNRLKSQLKINYDKKTFFPEKRNDSCPLNTLKRQKCVFQQPETVFLVGNRRLKIARLHPPPLQFLNNVQLLHWMAAW